MSMSCLQSTCRVACAALGALVMGTLAAPALRAQELSFNAALERAQQVAPGLQARAAQLVAAHEDAARATALPDPRLLLGLSNVPVEGAHAFDLRVDDMTMKQVGLMQEIPARAKREARAALAASRIDAAQAEQAATRLRVREATAQAWIALWAAQAMLDALDAQREQAQLAAELAKARLAGGGGSAV
ncbi:MAG: TolC family protein, partial [Rhodanobacteraceae bacterium]|nr:TolC family protein [Rhodanobacteraceae bacterium]